MELHIELNNPHRLYLSGQAVEGRVVIHNKTPSKVKEVTIILEGKGRVQLAIHIPRLGTDRYKNKENYVFYSKSLAGDGDNTTTLQEGTLSYPFRFVLPANIPCSFHSPNCQISYYLKAEIRRPLGKFNDQVKLPISVNGIYDLNLMPSASSPQECRKMIGSSFCLRKGPLSFLLVLPNRSGFVPGEDIYFRVEITNANNKKVGGVKASLLQVSKLYAMGISHTVNRAVCEVRGPVVDKGEYEVWSDKLTIPPLPPTRLGGTSQMIELDYALHVEMYTQGLDDPLTGEAPIMIGNIPLRSTFGYFLPDTAHLDIPSELEMDPIPSTSQKYKLREESQPENKTVTFASIFSDYPDIPPPSYAEAVGAEGMNGNDEGGSSDQVDNTGVKDQADAVPNSKKMFVPNYITYNKTIKTNAK